MCISLMFICYEHIESSSVDWNCIISLQAYLVIRKMSDFQCNPESILRPPKFYFSLNPMGERHPEGIAFKGWEKVLKGSYLQLL